MAEAKKYTHQHGRRKTAVARIRLFAGKGQFIVNQKPLLEYFGSLGPRHETAWEKPFLLTKTSGQYFATIKVAGGGLSSQLDAVIHGLARALSDVKTDFRVVLKKEGLLTRDPRAKERRKYGRAQKARKGKQSPKR